MEAAAGIGGAHPEPHGSVSEPQSSAKASPDAEATTPPKGGKKKDGRKAAAAAAAESAPKSDERPAATGDGEEEPQPSKRRKVWRQIHTWLALSLTLMFLACLFDTYLYFLFCSGGPDRGSEESLAGVLRRPRRRREVRDGLAGRRRVCVCRGQAGAGAEARLVREGGGRKKLGGRAFMSSKSPFS